VTLASRYREPMIAYRRPAPEQIAWLSRPSPSHPRNPARRTCPWIYAGRTMRMARIPSRCPSVADLPHGPVCIGPCRPRCSARSGWSSRNAAPSTALLVSLSHGYLGYLPTPRHFPLGGYETWIGTNQLEPQASEKMLDALLEMAAEVKH